jgi:hypothetical protein
MLESVGHPIRLVITGPAPFRPGFFSHIYLEVYHKGKWIPLDSTMPFPMGWAPKTFVKKVIAIERRANMSPEDSDLRGTATSQSMPEWLRGLIRAVRHTGLQPRDTRVSTLWKLLQKRNFLRQSPWLQARLRFIWRNGLARQSRPITTWRLVCLLRRWGILPWTTRTLRHVGIKPVQSLTSRPTQKMPAQPITQPIPPRVQRVALRPVARAQVIGRQV